MKRIIKFKIINNDYVFEDNEDKVFKINRTDIILNGAEFYEMFFHKFDKSCEFQLINELSDNDKKTDKMATPIFEEVKKIIDSIEIGIKDKIFKPVEKAENH
ncbi:MAG: hypothetical protein RR646_06750 [Erysipelotrichaceae bacterium]